MLNARSARSAGSPRYNARPHNMSRLSDITHRIQERVRELMAQNENQVFIGLTFVIGAVVGLVIVAFIVVTDSLEAWLYAEGTAHWRRLVTPIAATLFVGYLLYRFFPEARGSGVPQTKAAMFADPRLAFQFPSQTQDDPAGARASAERKLRRKFVGGF